MKFKHLLTLVVYSILGAVPLSAATIIVAAPTGVSATDISNINSAIAGSSAADTIQFRSGTYAQAGTTITLQGNRTYTCITIGTCSVTANNNTTNFNVTGTRSNLIISNLVLNGCGIELSGPGGGSGSGTALTGLSITHTAFNNCQVQSGTFINDNYSVSGLIQNNTFTDGGTCLQATDTCNVGLFSAIHTFRFPDLTIDNNVFTHVDRGIGQYFYNSDDAGACFYGGGTRITNNTFTRLHTRAIEIQGHCETDEVISGNYVHKWQNAFWGSWGYSMAQGFGNNPYTALRTIFTNNVADARDSVLDDLVTLHTEATLCIEMSGINTKMDSNGCYSLSVPEAGKPNYWAGWSSGILSGMINGTISNQCFGGIFISNQNGTNPNYFTFGDNGTSTTANLPTISGTLTPANANSCPNVLSSTPLITTASFPNGVTSNPYSFTTAVSGGTGPYTWAITAGSLPTGLTLATSTGIISGTPSGSGTSIFTIRVTDSVSQSNSLATFITITSAAGVISDQFTTPPLNAGLWTGVNPVGDGTIVVSGGKLNLTAPGAALHDPRFGNVNNSVRVIQSISGNFTAIAKFDSIPSQQYQFEGILVDQDSTHWMTLSAGSDGTNVSVNLDTSLAGVNIDIASAIITPGTSIWLSLSQLGTAWVAKYSLDGVNYTTLISFTQAFTTNDTGPFAGNYNASTPATPALTAIVDYFLNGTIPDMTITMSHSGSFAQSQTGATYTITATNSGGNATSGAVNVSVNIPVGLAPTALSGSGWVCVLANNACTRSDVLAATASYPAITLTVNVAANATTPLVPTSTVSGGGESNTANDVVTDSTTVTAVVTTHHVVVTAIGVCPGAVCPILTFTDTSNNVVFGPQTITASSAAYTYTTATLPASNIRVNFTNGATGRNVNITAFTVDGNSTSPTAATTFTLSSSPLCTTGFLRSTTLGCAGYMEFPIVNAVTSIDTTPPSTPAGLTATQIFSNAITLSWTGSVDDTKVVGYYIIRNGISTGVSSPVTTFTDNGISPGAYSFQVAAYDAANNISVLSSAAVITATSTGQVYNGGITSLGAIDFSGATSTIPCQSRSSEPLTGVSSRCFFNSAQGYYEVYLGPAGAWAVIPLVESSASWVSATTSLGGGGSSPVTLCPAAMCPAGSYEVEYRIWTTAALASSATILSFNYNDGTLARLESSSSLDNSAISAACAGTGCLHGNFMIVLDGINPVTYYTNLAGGAAYSGRIAITRKQ